VALDHGIVFVDLHLLGYVTGYPLRHLSSPDVKSSFVKRDRLFVSMSKVVSALTGCQRRTSMKFDAEYSILTNGYSASFAAIVV
jgi:hypothetical protein